MKEIVSFLILTLVMFSGCSTKTTQIEIQENKIVTTKKVIPEEFFKDLEPQKVLEFKDEIDFLPNDTFLYSKSLSNKFFSASFQKEMDEKFNKAYFRPWEIKKMTDSKKELLWAYYSYSKAKVYGENYLPLKKEWFEAQKENSNFDKLNSMGIKAITIINSSLRNFPTNKPIFKNKEQAGEGFPFDYAQNSSIQVNSPIFISHYSKDKAWAYVQSSFALGWIDVRDIAIVDENFIQKFKNNSYVVAIKERFPVYDTIENFKFFAKVGTIFPILNELKNEYLVGIPLKDLNGNAVFTQTKVSKELVAKKPINFNNINTALIAKELLNEPYSWGGLLDNRDCSSTTKDFFAPFGIWLPRNSKAQANAQIGEYVSLKNLAPQQKEKEIIKKAIPFLTIIYLKGHIMLYVGEHKGRAAVLHNAWGISTIRDGKEGRLLTGKTAITTLEPGKGIKGVNAKKTLLNRVEGMRILANEDDVKLFYTLVEQNKNNSTF